MMLWHTKKLPLILERCVSAATLTAVVVDAFGNPVPSQGIVLTLVNGGNGLSPSAGSTSAAGAPFVATLTSMVAQTRRVTATFAGAIVKAVRQEDKIV